MATKPPPVKWTGGDVRAGQAAASAGQPVKRAAVWGLPGTYAPVPGPFTPQSQAWLASRATHRAELAARADTYAQQVQPLTNTASLSQQRAAANLARSRVLKGAGY